jgi:hypothetical protein
MPSPNGPWFQNVGNAVPDTPVCNNRWIEKENWYWDEHHQKPLSVVITGPDAGKYEYISSVGYRNNGEKWSGTFTGSKLEGQTRTFNIQMKQPDREVVKLHRFAALSNTRGETTIAIVHSMCTVITTCDVAVDLQDTRVGVADLDESRIVDVILFPETVPVDDAAAHVFDAPPSTGDWTPQIVYVDPDGQPRPQGGVRWTSDGVGLTPGDACNLRVFMTSLADDTYYLYAFDAEAGAWQYFKVVSTQSIPTVSEWGLVVMTLLVLTVGTVVLGRRRRRMGAAG